MAESAIQSALINLVRRTGRVAPTVLVTAESRFVEDLGIDSLDLVAVYLAIQDELDVLIEDEHIPTLKRLGDVLSYVESRKTARAA